MYVTPDLLYHVLIFNSDTSSCRFLAKALLNHISWGQGFRDSRSARINFLKTKHSYNGLGSCSQEMPGPQKNPPFITKTHPKTVSCLCFWNVQVNVHTKLKGTGASVWFVLQPRPHWAETYTPHRAAFCWPTHRCCKRQLLLKVIIFSTYHLSPAKSQTNEQSLAKAGRVCQSHKKLITAASEIPDQMSDVWVFAHIHLTTICTRAPLLSLLHAHTYAHTEILYNACRLA